MKRRTYLRIFAVALLIVGSFYIVSKLRPQTITLGPLENISSIPFPKTTSGTQIFEDLAHSDVYIQELPIAKTLHLTITFIPHDTRSLAVGVRQDSFWFSYPRHAFYEAGENATTNEPLTQKITLPITTAFQETDGSLDLMFFADTSKPDNDPLEERTYWEVVDITAATQWTFPTKAEVYDYLRQYIS